MPTTTSAQQHVQPVLVAACGNRLAGDDGFGPSVARCLRALAPVGVDVIDLGMKPAGLLDHLADRAALIVVDAAQPLGEHPTAALIDLPFRSPERPPLLHDVALSSHGLSLAHELALADKLDLLPNHVHLIAAEAHVTQLGQPPSPQVMQLVEPAARRIVELAQAWLA
jgi:hydrogenase maturation protease